MRLSTSTNLMNFDAGKPYMVSMEHAMSALAAAGYRYLDANFCGMSRENTRFAPMTEDDWECRAHAWRKQAEDTGVAFRQGHAWFLRGGYVSSPDEAPGGAFGEEMMRRSVLAAEILGVEWLVVHPVGVKVNGEIVPEVTYQYNLAYFRRWQPFFAAHHVGMAIENMGGSHVFADPKMLCRLIDEIGAQNVGACLDTGHANFSGYDAAECVRMIGHRLRATHINDNNAIGRDEHLAPFMGTIQWTQVVQALRDIGYQHDFSFEIHNYTGKFPLRIQGDLVRFTCTLGNYLLSEELFEDAERLKQY